MSNLRLGLPPLTSSSEQRRHEEEDGGSTVASDLHVCNKLLKALSVDPPYAYLIE